jgi:hypothetical protein
MPSPEAFMSEADWPPLPLDAWKNTRDTLHMWTQIVGKICLATTPPVNHFWNATLHVRPRGLRTPTLWSDGRAFEMTFDFVEHQLAVDCADGRSGRVALCPRSVAEFYAETLRVLRALGITVHIWPMPVEVPDPIPFDRDDRHASYDPDYVGRFWRVVLPTTRVLEQFRSRFVGKVSPAHFFWGSFDLALTRFSGRRAPEREGADRVTRESYSHEVISHGFWPGGGAFPDAAFYAYAAPQPAGFEAAGGLPAGAFYDRNLSEFILPYEAVRRSPAPDATLMQFLQGTYDAGADLGGWDRAGLER